MQLTIPNLRGFKITSAAVLSFTLAACGGGAETTTEAVKEAASTTVSATTPYRIHAQNLF